MNTLFLTLIVLYTLIALIVLGYSVYVYDYVICKENRDNSLTHSDRRCKELKERYKRLRSYHSTKP